MTHITHNTLIKSIQQQITNQKNKMKETIPIERKHFFSFIFVFFSVETFDILTLYAWNLCAAKSKPKTKMHRIEKKNGSDGRHNTQNTHQHLVNYFFLNLDSKNEIHLRQHPHTNHSTEKNRPTHKNRDIDEKLMIFDWKI